MTKPELEAWIPFLKDSGVCFFKTEQFEISFFPPTTSKVEVPVSNIKTEKIEDVVVPQSLEEEQLMSVDQILNWSVDSDSTPVPLTGAGEANVR